MFKQGLQMTQHGDIRVEISPGELIDKITILGIKSERIIDSHKLKNVRAELALLQASCESAIPSSNGLNELTSQLKAVNERLWEIEDDIRDCERNQQFDEVFIELARSVFKNNDQRALIKRQINELLGSRLIEEKSYREYE
jgi:hypothetical protein